MSEPEVPVNVLATLTGKLRPVCEFCGKIGRAVAPSLPGRLTIMDVAQGWTSAPYSPEFIHPDGSAGTKWTCPACQKRLDRGEVLRTRSEAAS